MSNETYNNQNQTEEQLNNIQEIQNMDPEALPVISETIQEDIEEIQEQEIINQSLLTGTLGYVNFDAGSVENNTTHAMVSAEKRKLFRRDVYVLITDKEQSVEFLGRVIEGPFHSPHEISTDSAITRTTVLNPERTKFRPSYYVYGTIEVLGQLVNSERVVPTPTRPRPYSEITVFPAERLKHLLDIEGDFYLGHLMGYEGVSVCTDSNNKNFLPRNVGIFGTVGSGKSNTTQVLIEEATKAGWAVVVIDVEGEYVKMNEATDDVYLAQLLKEQHKTEPQGVSDFKVYLPTSGESTAVNPTRFKVPISELEPHVVGDIQEFSEPQMRMYERVVDFSRRQNSNRNRGNARLGNFNGVNTAPYINELEQLKNRYPNENILHDDLDILIAKHQPLNTNYAFTLQNIIDNLEDNAFIQTIQPVERTTASTLRSKLISIGRSGMLDWNSTNATAYLPIQEMLVGKRLSVLDVSETDDRSRNIAIAYVLQSLFNKVIEYPVGHNMSNGVPRPKVMVVLEEVHTFVSRSSASKMRAVLDNLQLISRRGRKRWMSLAIVSQQPGHVPDELFELANTRFIHQLKSASNLAPVRQTTGGVHEALWTNLPSLGPGQCLLTGAVFKNPIFVNIRPAKSKREHTN